jgi:hypothetical protein
MGLMDKHTLSPSNTYTLGFHLIAKAALILPQGCSNPRLGSGRRNLACGIIDEALQRRSGAVPIPRRSRNGVVADWAH